MPSREDIRNIAIIAHVDHGKTTLVDAMLRQSGVFSAHKQAVERVMDSMDQERERGITILAKNAAVRYGDTKINLVDTPGHADFGGEVERGLTMVDGVLLLVDASEGPLPQTRFVLRKALALHLPVILVVNKVDRPDARIGDVVDEVYELFLDLDADESQIDFPIVYTNAKAGWAATDEGVEGENLRPLFELILATVPAPTYSDGHGLQALVTNLDASPYVGRLAICRVHEGTIKRGQTVAWCRLDGSVAPVRVTELYITDGMARVDADEAGPGEIIALAGLPDVMIGETIADAEDPRPLPPLTVDEPALGMTIGINTSPLAGKSGDKLTARLLQNRLDQELVGNVSIEVKPTARPDTWEVQGRGELQLAVLVETLRREGFELTVGKPQVAHPRDRRPSARAGRAPGDRHPGGLPRRDHAAAGAAQGPDGPDGESRHGLGAARVPDSSPRPDRLPHRVHDRDARHRHPALGLRALRALARGDQDAAERLARGRPARRHHPVRAAASCQERGQLFLGPGEEVYEGMIVGENSRSEDLDVNAVREKKLTNIRSSTADELVRLAPHHQLSLDQALDFIREDESVEVTPAAVRLRKVELNAGVRQKLARGSKPDPVTAG